MQGLFKSDEFKRTAGDPKARKEIIGNSIFEYVEKIIGSEGAPKITGMIIDLEDLQLIPAISTLENLTLKARDAMTLLMQLKLQQETSNKSQAVVAPVTSTTAASHQKRK